MKKTKIITLCGMMAALAVVIMILGGILELGMYAAPMLSGLCLITVGKKYGRKYHLAMWGVVSVISFILVPQIEQNLMFLCLFGLYPIIYPCFRKMPKALEIITKLLYFNIVTVSIEALVMLVLVPEMIDTAMTLALLIMGNITFVLYDFVIPRAELIFEKYLGRFLRNF